MILGCMANGKDSSPQLSLCKALPSGLVQEAFGANLECQILCCRSQQGHSSSGSEPPRFALRTVLKCQGCQCLAADILEQAHGSDASAFGLPRISCKNNRYWMVLGVVGILSGLYLGTRHHNSPSSCTLSSPPKSYCACLRRQVKQAAPS